ncbi:ATP-binding protein [Bradyrhizobium erythrophlei]|uniref:ATP-binding protein n=1 Tax=Bradyrhizobium erythrophlei TaxID=1437360 RepID=UPI0035E66359
MLESLRGRLFIGFTAIIVVTGCIGGLFAYVWAFNEAIEMQDAVLIQIGAVVQGETFPDSQPVTGVDAEARVTVAEIGKFHHDSDNDRQFVNLPDGLHNGVREGQPVRILLRTRPDTSRIAVMQRTTIRDETAGEMALRTLLPIAALIPCLMLVTAFVIERSLRPMVRLAHDLDVKRADDMHELPAVGTPSELYPFITSINGLLARMRNLMDQQRRFVADAAHELRTPITALSLQAENLDTVDLPGQARERIGSLKEGMRRTKRLLEQLLTLARQDSTPSGEFAAVSLDQIAKEVVADLLPEAASREIDVGFEMVEAIAVRGELVALTSLVRNLVENAIKFTPKGGQIDLGVYREGERAVLQVEDTGPGISQGDLDRAFEPFYRGRHPTGEGAGLGLSIVKRIVDKIGGSIVLENITDAGGRSGLRATVKLRLA